MPARRPRISLAEAELYRRTLRLGERELHAIGQTAPVVARHLDDLCAPRHWAPDGVLRACLPTPDAVGRAAVSVLVVHTARARLDDAWLDASEHLADMVCDSARSKRLRLRRSVVLRDLAAFLGRLRAVLAREGWTETETAAAHSAWVKAGLLHMAMWMPEVSVDDATAES